MPFVSRLCLIFSLSVQETPSFNECATDKLYRSNLMFKTIESYLDTIFVSCRRSRGRYTSIIMIYFLCGV